MDRLPNTPLERVVPDVDPPVEGHGYPKWYRDTTGLPLQLCHTNTISQIAGATPGDPIGLQPLMCLLAYPLDNPDVLADPLGYPGNHGEEAFYMAVAPADAAGVAGLVGNGISVGMDLALEAAYETGPPVRGDEMVFGRIRIRIDLNRTDAADPKLPPNPNLPVSGTYVVTHPYGVDVFPNVGEGGRSVNTTIDVGITKQQFDIIVNEGRIGPFLTWTTFDKNPAASDQGLVYRDGLGNVVEHYIGDPNVAHQIKGSPFVDDAGRPTNYVRIDGPPGCAIGGFDANNVPIDFIETDLFLVSGKVWTKPIPAQLTVPRATYSRDASSAAVAVWATADVAFPNNPSPSLVVTGENMPNLPMAHDGAGTFFAQAVFAPEAPLPASVTVLNSTDGGPPAVAGVTDLVTGTATWDISTGLLDVRAQSSDRSAASPQLAVLGTGTMTPDASVPGAAALVASLAAAVPPRTLNLVSSAGGTARIEVDVIGTGGVPSTLPPTAVGDEFSTAENVLGVFPVAANDSAVAPAALATIQILSNPAHGNANVSGADPLAVEYRPATNWFGTDSFTYAVKDSLGQLSNAVTVTVTVNYVAIPPVALADATSTRVGFPVALEILKNDAAANGTLVPGSVTIVTPPSLGTVEVNPLTGLATYTPGAVAGLDAFTYTVSDSFGVASAPATASVRIVDATDAVTIARASYVVTKGRWLIEGSVSIFGADLAKTVRVYNGGDATFPLLATLTVQADGTFKWASPDGAPAPSATRLVTVVSSGGGRSTARVLLR